MIGLFHNCSLQGQPWVYEVTLAMSDRNPDRALHYQHGGNAECSFQKKKKSEASFRRGAKNYTRDLSKGLEGIVNVAEFSLTFA
jgi:hypothetical protein